MKHIIFIERLRQYLYDTISVQPGLWEISKDEQKSIPFYLNETYTLYYGDFFYGNEFTLMIPKSETLPTVGQLKKNAETIEDRLQRRTVLILDTVPSYIRKRLIQAKINFIVPGKQMFMPNIRIDLNERVYVRPKKSETLMPSAQFIVLYQILSKDDSLEKYSFKELGKKIGYSAMAITKAVGNLKVHDLCEIEGTKEKFIRFIGTVPELWNKANPILINPVLKRVYVENYPGNELLYSSNMSALAEYSDITPGKQKFLALKKSLFYNLRKENRLTNLNDHEGEYCLEIWKYDSGKLIEDIAGEATVDPLSLYLSLKDTQDERIEMALEKIIKDYIW